jgi:hypothetical protein
MNGAPGRREFARIVYEVGKHLQIADYQKYISENSSDITNSYRPICIWGILSRFYKL